MAVCVGISLPSTVNTRANKRNVLIRANKCNVLLLANKCNILIRANKCNVVLLANKCNVLLLANKCNVRLRANKCNVLMHANKCMCGHNRLYIVQGRISGGFPAKKMQASAYQAGLQLALKPHHLEDAALCVGIFTEMLRQPVQHLCMPTTHLLDEREKKGEEVCNRHLIGSHSFHVKILYRRL